MKYTEFLEWANCRACDGRWGMNTAILCIQIITEVSKQRFWRREKYWQENFADDVVTKIVRPINQKIAELEAQA